MLGMHRMVLHQRFPQFRRTPFWWCGVLLVLLAACASSTTPTATSNSSPNPEQQPVPLITTLTIWHSWSGAQADALNVVARQYEQNNPLVRIQLEAQPAATLLRTFGARVADASAPQIVIAPGRYLGELAERQYLVPLDQASFALGDLLPAAVDAGRSGDQLYGVPLTWDALVLFYDRRAIPDVPTRFEDLIALEQTTPLSGTTQWNMGYYLSLDRTLPYLPIWDGALFDDTNQPVFATTSRDATIGWLGWLRELHTNPTVLATQDFGALDEMIQAGRVRSVIDWGYKRSLYEQLWGADALGIAPLPTLRNTQPQTMVRAEIAAINAVITDEQRRAAEAFLRYALDVPAQTLLAEQGRGAMLPVHSGAPVDASGEALRAAAASAQGFTSDLHGAWQPLDSMLTSVLNGTNPVEAVDAANTRLGNRSVTR